MWCRFRMRQVDLKMVGGLWVFLAGCVLLALIIVAGFWSAVVRGAEREEEESMLDVYLAALGMIPGESEEAA